MTKIEADVFAIDDVSVLGKKVTVMVEDDDHVPPAPEPDPAPPVDNGDLKALIKAAVEDTLLNAEAYPDDLVDVRDVVPVISNNKLVAARLRDIPGVMGGTPSSPFPAPAINTRMGTRGTVYIPDEGAREGDRNACRTAMVNAARKIRDGGRIFLPFGRWPMNDVELPTGKDLVIEGETETGSVVIGSPERDTFFMDDPGSQRRLQNRKIFRHIKFHMPGNGNRGAFKRRTELGFQAGAGAVVVRMPASEGDRRKDSWGPSYIEFDHVQASGEKDAVGACLFYSDRPCYGMRVKDVYIGDHGSSVSGLHGGIIFGRPPVQLTEATSDKFVVNTFVHWGGVCSIAAYNVANGEVRDHEVYACEMALHLTGYDDKSRNRSRCRQMELSGLYYDNDMRAIRRGGPPMVHVNSDTTILGSMHVKGARHGEHSPVVEIKGRNFRGGVIDIMSSSHHKSPIFKIQGDGHDFAIEAAGVPEGHRRTMINGKDRYLGVEVI